MQGDYTGAAEYARKAIDFNRYNISAHEFLALMLQKTR